jgi:hypothetical protein
LIIRERSLRGRIKKGGGGGELEGEFKRDGGGGWGGGAYVYST